jgi:hypothetical protein
VAQETRRQVGRLCMNCGGWMTWDNDLWRCSHCSFIVAHTPRVVPPPEEELEKVAILSDN